MNVELEATATHLHKAAWSNESYYRKHYAGLERLQMVFEWMNFRLLDFIWGNGENVARLFRFLVLVLLVMTIYDTAWHNGDPKSLYSYGASAVRSFAVFFGALSPNDYSPFYLALITSVRLVLVGFFLSIIIKRFNRR